MTTNPGQENDAHANGDSHRLGSPGGPAGPDSGELVLGPLPDDALPPIPAGERDYVFRGTEVRSLLDRIEQGVDELEQAMTSLPHVEDDGGSECPFADELYDKKEDLEAEVRDAIQRMQVYDADLQLEMQRVQANRSRVQADGTRLNLPQTQDHYRQAEELLDKQYRQLVQDREAIAVVMARAQAVLQVSQRRKLSGHDPQGPSPTFPGSQAEPPGGPGPGRGSLSQEVDDLLSLGPLGTRQE